MHRPTAIEDRRGGPQRVVRAGNQHLVAVVEQRPQHQVDQLGNAVADEHVLDRHLAQAALLLLHHHRLARGKDALLVYVALGGAQVFDHREAHRLRRTKAESPGIADIQRNNIVAKSLHFLGATGKLATNLVTNAGERAGGAQGWDGHGPRIAQPPCREPRRLTGT